MRETTVDRFLDRAKSSPDAIAFWEPAAGGYAPRNWRYFAETTINFAKGLLVLGHKPSDGLAILGYNRPQWIMGCMGVQCIQGVSAGIYTACSPEEVEHVIAHSEAPFVLVENAQRYHEQIEPRICQLGCVRRYIFMDPIGMPQAPNMLAFEDVVNLGRAQSDKLFEERVHAIEPDDVATLIYTSGTTGPAKGVMLSHRSIHWTVKTAVDHLKVNAQDVLLSYLPLAHVAEQMFSVYAPMHSGIQVYFAESFDKLPDNLKEAQPTVFFGVPRVYEKFHEKIQEKLAEVDGIKRKLFDHFYSSAQKYWELKYQSQPIPLTLLIQHELGQRLVFKKVKSAIGFSRLRLCVSGAAPIARHLLDFFCGLDLPIYEVYGQSEGSGPTAFNFPGLARAGTVGLPLPGTHVKIAADGEILLKGPNVFKGYFKDPIATKETLVDGWLHSGDVGEFTAEGFLKITDRKKEILITAGGKNVSPQNIESMLKQIALINSAVVIGDKRKYLVALLTPNWEMLRQFAKQNELQFAEENSLIKNTRILEQITQEINRLNQRLAPVEQIKKFRLLPQDFTIENGELTPTMKLRRRVINSRYQSEIEGLYVS